jgi:hypothetical protein
MDEKIQQILNGILANGARIKVTDENIYIKSNTSIPNDLARAFRANETEIRKLIKDGVIDEKYLTGEYPDTEDQHVHHDVKNVETPDQIDNRHSSIKVIAKINNFIGWICVISIILSPLGLIILIQGHLILAIIEVEHNTRSTNHLTQKLLDKLEKLTEEKKNGEAKE